MLVVLLSLACFWPLDGGPRPGSRAMGEECEQSEDCVDDGTCLKGVCEGYACRQDGDCENGHVCAEGDGWSACALPCDGDGDCPGGLTCAMADEGGYCL